MIIWLPEDLYRHVKDDSTYNNIISRINSVKGNGDLSTYADLDSYKNFLEYKEIISSENEHILEEAKKEFNLFFENLNLPAHLKIKWQISQLTDELDTILFKNSLDSIEENINLIQNSPEKIGCQIYLIQHKIFNLLENLNYSYFHPEVYALRKEIVRLYNSDTRYSYNEETHITAYFNKADIFFIENLNSDVYSGIMQDSSHVISTYERLFKSLQFYEETSLRSHPTEYMKNALEYTKTYIRNHFYSYFVTQFNRESDTFAKLDDWFEKNYNSTTFKYADFNYHKIKNLWNRYTSNMSHSEYERGMSILQTIYDIISNEMQNKNLMGKKLNYLNSGCYHNRFFAFLSSIRYMEKEILSDFPLYTKKNQFNNLRFSENEEKLIAMDWDKDDGVSREKLMPEWNILWLRQKLTG